jgi:hypothetical protein
LRGRKESGSEEDARGMRERGSEKDGEEGERTFLPRRHHPPPYYLLLTTSLLLVYFVLSIPFLQISSTIPVSLLPREGYRGRRENGKKTTERKERY